MQQARLALILKTLMSYILSIKFSRLELIHVQAFAIKRTKNLLV